MASQPNNFSHNSPRQDGIFHHAGIVERFQRIRFRSASCVDMAHAFAVSRQRGASSGEQFPQHNQHTDNHHQDQHSLTGALDMSHDASPHPGPFRQQREHHHHGDQKRKDPAQRGKGIALVHRRAPYVSSQITFNSRVSSSIDMCSCVCVGGVNSCPANQASGGARRRVRTSEQLFERTSPRPIPRNSAASSACFGRSSPRSIWRSAPASASATRNTSSTASANPIRAQRSRSMRRLSTERRAA